MASLQNSQTLSTLVGEIHLSQKHPNGVLCWLFVEGESDAPFFECLINERVMCRELGGVKKVRQSLHEIFKTKPEFINCVIGIIDADFSHLNQELESQQNLFLTDTHDLETLMIACDETFYKLMATYKYENKTSFKEIRNKLLSSISFLGGIRWLNDKEQLKLNFNGINLNEFYNFCELTLNKEKCLSHIIKLSSNKKREVTITEIDVLIANISDYYNLCNGHDAEKVIAGYLSIGRKKAISDKELSEKLMLAYQKECFKNTQLYQNINQWQADKNFKVFSF